MQTLPYLLIFLLGINIGSFLNVCIYRIPLGKTIVKGRSYCPKCNRLIPWYYNIPILSYLILGGKCAYCKSPISLIYPSVEVLNGLLYLLAFYLQGFTVSALLVSIIISILIVISFIDAEYQLIPDGLVLTILLLALINLVYQVQVNHMPWTLYIIGFFAASLPLFILALIYKDGLGGGDIKLMAVAGLYLGWKLALLSLFLGSMAALAYVVFLFLRKEAGRGTAIPFGPFLSMGIVGAIFFGNSIIAWYLTTFF